MERSLSCIPPQSWVVVDVATPIFCRKENGASKTDAGDHTRLQEPKTWIGKPYENQAMIDLTMIKCKNELEKFSAKSNQDKLCY